MVTPPQELCMAKLLEDDASDGNDISFGGSSSSG